MTGGVYAGMAAVERRAARRGRLLEAALELLGGEGWHATTVRGICARAGLTPRYFYESFADLDELLLALFDQLANEAAFLTLDAVVAAPEDARAKSRAAIEAFIRLVTDDPRKARVLFVEAVGSEALTRRRYETLRVFASLVAQQGREFYGMQQSVDPLIESSALMCVGGIAEILLAWLDGTLRCSRERLIDDCTDLFVATGEGVVELLRGRGAGS
jgi:AcrR family transcriptional regulator